MKNSKLYYLLEDVTNSAFESLVQESEYNFDAVLALKLKIVDNNIVIDKYIIESTVHNIYGTNKIYYNIYDSDTNEYLYKDICLFITVKIIINLKLNNKPINDYLIILDTKYGSLLNSALFYKNKIEHERNKRNIYMAKYDGNLMNLSSIRTQIENFDK